MSFTSSLPNRSPQAGHLRDRLSMFFWTHSRQNVCMHRIRHVVFSRSSQTLHRNLAWASRSSDLSMSSPACAACARRRLTSRCAASSAPCSFVFWRSARPARSFSPRTRRSASANRPDKSPSTVSSRAFMASLSLVAAAARISAPSAIPFNSTTSASRASNRLAASSPFDSSVVVLPSLASTKAFISAITYRVASSCFWTASRSAAAWRHSACCWVACWRDARQAASCAELPSMSDAFCARSSSSATAVASTSSSKAAFMASASANALRSSSTPRASSEASPSSGFAAAWARAAKRLTWSSAPLRSRRSSSTNWWAVCAAPRSAAQAASRARDASVACLHAASDFFRAVRAASKRVCQSASPLAAASRPNASAAASRARQPSARFWAASRFATAASSLAVAVRSSPSNLRAFARVSGSSDLAVATARAFCANKAAWAVVAASAALFANNFSSVAVPSWSSSCATRFFWTSRAFCASGSDAAGSVFARFASRTSLSPRARASSASALFAWRTSSGVISRSRSTSSARFCAASRCFRRSATADSNRSTFADASAARCSLTDAACSAACKAFWSFAASPAGSFLATVAQHFVSAAAAAAHRFAIDSGSSPLMSTGASPMARSVAARSTSSDRKAASKRRARSVDAALSFSARSRALRSDRASRLYWAWLCQRLRFWPLRKA
mmetsp:Transcript_24972/g.64885  ORF Transcript_24972/g.64885 Transcript_24972/m.64885 type:complete len:678 (-) Transcript_24972:328-2361(-)